MKYDFIFLYHPHFYDVKPGAQMGLGLLNLATYARALGASVRVINCQSIKRLNAVYIAIYNCKNLMLYGCLIDLPILNTIAANVKIKGLADHIFLGGPVASSLQNIDFNYIDCAVMGPGEDFIEQLCDDPFAIAKTSIVFDELKKNINEYPFPDRSLLQGEYGENIFKRKASMCETSTTLLTSRGCKYHCAFCMSGNNSFCEDYSLERIEKELEHCLSLGLKNIKISDDNLVGDRLFSLCKLFKEAKIKWRANMRVSATHYDIMAESGCEEISFGIESGDQRVLNILNKGITVRQSIKAVYEAKKGGIPFIRALLMMGTPGETFSTLSENIEWVEKARPDMVSLKMFVPYPDTKVYNDPEKYGCELLDVIDTNNSVYRPDGSSAKANIKTNNMTDIELTAQFHKMREFLERKCLENRG